MVSVVKMALTFVVVFCYMSNIVSINMVIFHVCWLCKQSICITIICITHTIKQAVRVSNKIYQRISALCILASTFKEASCSAFMVESVAKAKVEFLALFSKFETVKFESVFFFDLNFAKNELLDILKMLLFFSTG